MQNKVSERYGKQLVSVIVPIYNVEQYMDRCIKSIVEQSYPNIEIILINDGSTDCSPEKAQAWREKDSRIKVIHLKNQGPGPTRMRGISEAKGDYLAFIDSDDWVHTDFLKRMLEKALEQSAEVVYCNVDKIWSGKQRKVETIRFPQLSPEGFRADEHPEILNQCGCWICNKLFSRELWNRLELVQPAETVEDICTIFVLLGKAKRIAQVSGEALYFYCQRQDSISFDGTFPRYFQNAIKVAEKNCEVYSICQSLRFYVGKTIGDSLSFVKLHFKGRAELADEIAKMEQSFLEHFGQGLEKRTVIFGSFTLRAIMKEAFYYVPEYFGFSNLISAMHPVQNVGEAIQHSNLLREDAVQKEITGDFLKRLAVQGKELNFLIMDFLEGRHDIIKLEKGGYITKSDAYEGVQNPLDERGKIIFCGSDEFFRLWHNSCAKLDKVLKKAGFSGKIFLVKNRMTDSYRKDGKLLPFKGRERIAELNQVIERLEEIFLDYFGDVVLINALDEKIHYADYEYTHGCFPWHFNTEAYLEAGKIVRRELLNVIEA